jgi:predicted ATPase/DNA-binding XRE family transcriptional regulator
MPAMDAPDFAGLLRRYRRRRGLTQEELAERAGISAASVSLLERGLTHAPQKATVQMLSAALALSPEEAARFVTMARGSRRSDERESVEDSFTLAGAAGDGHLPVPLTALIGREADEAALLDMLGRETTRLLTLTGPAGVGKTRLALQVATMMRRAGSPDVVFVDLIPVQESERVLPAIAQALGVRDSGSVPLRDSLVHMLRERTLLLVLDNFEQVLPAARALLDLLIACPRVQALVTSRSPLNVRGERCFPVAPLALPDPARVSTMEEMRQVPTVALFLERASAGWPNFSGASDEDIRMVASICARLDGLPLAIELAAARVRLLGLRQLYERLSDPAFLSVLADGPQDLADHQRTMRSTIAWSYDQLTQTQRRLFRVLGVFVGGATIDALEAVSGLAHDTTLSDLTALVNASLVHWVDADGARRYTQMVTLGAYARERLHADGEWDEARRRHAGYFLDLVELLLVEGSGRSERTLGRVDVEYENVREALAWALETEAILHGLRMVGALWRFWISHSQYLEGLEWLERFIPRAGPPTSREEQSALAEAWTSVLALSHRLNRLERAIEAGETALALRRALGDQTQLAYALNNLANPVMALHDFERATALLNECLTINHETGYRLGLVIPLMNLGALYHEMGRPQEALAWYEQSLAVSREVGESDYDRSLTWNGVGEAYIDLDEPSRAISVTEPSYQRFLRLRDIFGAATCAFTLGRAEWRVGQLDRARTYLDIAENLSRALGNPVLAARILYFRTSVALQQDDIAAARRDLAQALADLADHAPDSEYLWWLVERAGTLACQQGELQRAVRLYGAALAHRDTMPRPAESAECALRTRDLDRLRAELGEAAWPSALAEGRTITHEEAIALVRQALE